MWYIKSPPGDILHHEIQAILGQVWGRGVAQRRGQAEQRVGHVHSRPLQTNLYQKPREAGRSEVSSLPPRISTCHSELAPPSENGDQGLPFPGNPRGAAASPRTSSCKRDPGCLLRTVFQAPLATQDNVSRNPRSWLRLSRAFLRSHALSNSGGSHSLPHPTNWRARPVSDETFPQNPRGTTSFCAASCWQPLGISSGTPSTPNSSAQTTPTQDPHPLQATPTRPAALWPRPVRMRKVLGFAVVSESGSGSLTRASLCTPPFLPGSGRWSAAG